MNSSRSKIIISIVCIFLISLTILLYRVPKDEYAEKIPILTFHRLVEDKVKKEMYPDNQWVGSIDVFEEMMKYLYDNGYKTISTEEFYKWYNKEIELPKKTVLITLDDGFYEDYYLAYPIIKKYGFKATSFVVGSRVSDITKEYNIEETNYLGLDVINKVKNEYPNYEFQSHSYNMHYYTEDGLHRIRSMSYEDIKEDLEKMKSFNFTTMAYPFGDFNDDIKMLLEEYNYLCAFRFAHSDYARRSNERYEIYRIKINGEANLNTLKKWLNY